MTLRGRTLIIVGIAMLALLIGQYAGLRYAFVRALTRLENDSVRQQINQARGEIRKEIANIDSMAGDYAAWDKTYSYVVTRNPEFVASDLADEALRRLRLDAVAIVDASGRQVLFRSLLTGVELDSLRTTLLRELRQGGPLVTFPNLDASHQGILKSPDGAIAVAVRPVVTSEGTGPSRGTLLMARRFDDREIRRIGETIHLAVALTPVPRTGLPPGHEVRIEPVSADRLLGEMPLLDIDGVPQWILRVDAERPLQREGERWFLYFVLAFLVSVIVVAMVTLALLDRIVLRRLGTMSRAVARIAHTGDLTHKVFAGGRDELSAVGSAIDSMLDSIRESRAAAERSAKEASRLKSEFLASMSHEIRTPLNGVLGTLRILEDTPLNPDQEDLVRTSLGCADGLLGLLNDVLDLSKIEAGKMTLVSEPIDVRTMAEDALSMFGPLVGSKPVDLLVRVAADVPARLMGDYGRVRQVLVNLIGNAVKFTEAGHVLIEISREPTEGPSRAPDSLIVRISDSGVGIPPDRLSAIFDSFTQADAATTRRFGGTGLGLTITRRLLTLMEGGVDVVSRPGHGSAFSFWLPLHAAPFDERPPTPGGVLLIDPPGLRRSVHAETLRGLGLTVVEADTLAAAAGQETGSADLAPDVVAIIQPSDLQDDGRALDALFERHRRIAVIVRNRNAAIPACAAKAIVLVQPISREHWLRLLGKASAVVPSVPVVHFGGRVLLAEDNPVNQMVAVGLLKKFGCEVDTAVTGHDAVQLAARTSYDLILMDCEMPHMDGYEATAEIRRQPRLTRVPIVALTAHAMTEARARCFEAGMDDFITKPFKASDIQAVLKQHLHAAHVIGL